MSCGWHLGLRSQAPCQECGEQWLHTLSIPFGTILCGDGGQAQNVCCATVRCSCHACDQQQQALCVLMTAAGACCEVLTQLFKVLWVAGTSCRCFTRRVS